MGYDTLDAKMGAYQTNLGTWRHLGHPRGLDLATPPPPATDAPPAARPPPVRARRRPPLPPSAGDACVTAQTLGFDFYPGDQDELLSHGDMLCWAGPSRRRTYDSLKKLMDAHETNGVAGGGGGEHRALAGGGGEGAEPSPPPPSREARVRRSGTVRLAVDARPRARGVSGGATRAGAASSLSLVAGALLGSSLGVLGGVAAVRLGIVSSSLALLGRRARGVPAGRWLVAA